MKIYYCDHCGKRVAEEELESGSAVVEADDTAFCAACTTELGKARPSGRRTPSPGNTRTSRHTPQAGVKQIHASTAQSAGTQKGHSGAPSERRHLPEAVTRKNVLPHLALGALALLILFGVSYILKLNSNRNQSSGAASSTPVVSPKTVAVAGANSDSNSKMTAPPEASKALAPPGGLFAEALQEHAREADPVRRKILAVSKLAAAREFAAKNPQDPWRALELFDAVPDKTPAADEAVLASRELRQKLPATRSGTPGWFRDWNFENRSTDESVVMLYEFDRRKNILKTLPPGRDAELFILRKLTVPPAPALLVFSARASDNGACVAALEVNGKLQIIDVLKGRNWNAFELDLSALAGQIVDLKIRHIATGWDDESAYWSEPVFVSAHNSAAHAAAYNPNAPAYGELWNHVAARAAKTPFKGSFELRDDERWLRALNLLVLADPHKGARDSEWKRLDSGALKSSKNKSRDNGARLEISFNCPAEFDVRAVFERKSGNGDAALLLPHPASGGNFCWCIGAADNRFAALTEVGGKRFDNNPACVGGNKILENNRKYTTVVEVRKDRVSAYLDGRLLVEWTPNMGALKAQDAWKLNDQTHPALASWDSEVVFYSFELVEIK